MGILVAVSHAFCVVGSAQLCVLCVLQELIRHCGWQEQSTLWAAAEAQTAATAIY